MCYREVSFLVCIFFIRTRMHCLAGLRFTGMFQLNTCWMMKILPKKHNGKTKMSLWSQSRFFTSALSFEFESRAFLVFCRLKVISCLLRWCPRGFGCYGVQVEPKSLPKSVVFIGCSRWGRGIRDFMGLSLDFIVIKWIFMGIWYDLISFILWLFKIAMENLQFFFGVKSSNPFWAVASMLMCGHATEDDMVGSPNFVHRKDGTLRCSAEKILSL